MSTANPQKPQDWIIKKGMRFYRKLVRYDDSGAHEDYTGKTVLMQIRTGIGGTLIAEWGTTPESGITIDGSGDVVIDISASLTALLTAGRYVYDIAVTDDAGVHAYFGSIVPNIIVMDGVIE